MKHPPRIARTIYQSVRKPNPRRAANHLKFIRELDCMVCGSPWTQAAHVRAGTDGGTGMKPGDRYTVPLCMTCHEKQHRIGELSFWGDLGIDPVDQANKLWSISGDLKAGMRI